MSLASKHVARSVRVLVACFALGLLAPAPAAAAASSVDAAIAWAVAARVTAERTPVRATVAHAVVRVTELPALAPRANARSPYPPRARAFVARRRLFLRHGALLC